MSRIVAPIVPAVDLPTYPDQPAGPLRRGPLPAISLPDMAARDPGLVVGMAAMDAKGRLRESVVLPAMGWTAGTQLTVTIRSGRLIFDRFGSGRFVTGQGHLRIPVPAQRWCGLHAGDRALLIGYLDRAQLVVCPPGAMAVLFRGILAGGEAA